MWNFFNSPLIVGLTQALLIIVIGGFFLAWFTNRWQEERQTRELQLETFRAFSDASADVIIRLTDLYHLRDTVPETEFRGTARQAAYKKLALLQMDAEMFAVFHDESLFQDLLRVKEITNRIQQGAVQSPTKAPLEEIESFQNRYLWQTKIMQMKMLREMGRMTQEEYEQGVGRLQNLLEGAMLNQADR